MNRIGVPVLALALAGCASNMSMLTADFENPEQLSIAQQNELINKSLEPCDTFFGVKTAEATERGKQAWRWTLAGIISASVIAPALTAANAAANAPWIAGFSGFGGASVAAVNNANSFGVGYASSIGGIMAMADAVRDDIAIALDVGRPFTVRTEAAGKASAKCSKPMLVDGYYKAEDATALQRSLDERQKALDARQKVLEDRLLEIQEKQRQFEGGK